MTVRTSVLPRLHANWHIRLHRGIVRNWKLILIAIVLFAISIYLIHSEFTAGVIVARGIEAFGDVILDRGFTNFES